LKTVNVFLLKLKKVLVFTWMLYGKTFLCLENIAMKQFNWKLLS